MRSVVHVLDNLAVGGCQTCVRALMQHTGKIRRHLCVSLRTQRNQIDLGGVDVEVFPSTSRYSLTSPFRLMRFVRRSGATILHCYLFKSQVCGLVVRWLKPDTKLIFHEGGRITMREHEPWWEPIIYKSFLRFAAPWVDMFLANSQSTLDELRKVPAIRDRPGRVVYNSILERVGGPSEEDRLNARQSLGIPADSIVFGFAGRIIERKGWRDFVACARRLSGKSGIFWVMAGDGSEEQELRRILAREGLINIKYLGFQQSMFEFYNSLDVCIIPSHWEPHGLVQLEAHSFGLPVIAANVMGMNETLEDGVNSLLFTPGDVEQLLATIERFLRSPELASSLSEGALKNAKRFTIGRYHDALEACYDAL